MATDPDFSVVRPDRPGIRKALGDLEADVLELVWTRPPSQGTTVRDVFEVLYERRRIAYTTVMNTMARMARKNLLRVEKAEHAYVYYPTLTEDEFVTRFVEHILENLLVSFSGATLASLRAMKDPEAAARARLLLDDIARTSSPAKQSQSPRGSRDLAYAIGIALPVIAVLFYLPLANQNARSAVQPAADSEAPAAPFANQAGGMTAQVEDDGAELDRLRPGAEDQ